MNPIRIDCSGVRCFQIISGLALVSHMMRRPVYRCADVSAFRNRTEEKRGLAAVGGEGKHSRGARVEASILKNDLDIGKAVTIPATMRG